MIEFDLDKTGYFSISEKGAFDMVDAQIILTPNEVEELKKALTLTDVMRSDCEIEEIVEQNKDYVLGFYTGDELKEYLNNNYA